MENKLTLVKYIIRAVLMTSFGQTLLPVPVFPYQNNRRDMSLEALTRMRQETRPADIRIGPSTGRKERIAKNKPEGFGPLFLILCDTDVVTLLLSVCGDQPVFGGSDTRTRARCRAGTAVWGQLSNAPAASFLSGLDI